MKLYELIEELNKLDIDPNAEVVVQTPDSLDQLGPGLIDVEEVRVNFHKDVVIVAW